MLPFCKFSFFIHDYIIVVSLDEPDSGDTVVMDQEDVGKELNKLLHSAGK